jgi:peptidoglycan/xylan/chitin deacetylase (PgdA/CDA1 family)
MNSSLLRFDSRLQERYPSILWRGDASRRAVALTFDDGPHLRDTPRVLDVLAKHDVSGTFHLVGKYAELHHHLIREVHQRGHQLALHCYRHVPFPLEDLSRLRTHLDLTRDIISQACGVPTQTIKDLRPPYGAFNKRNLAHLTEWGYRLVMWTCIPPHWMQPVSWSIRQVTEALVPGAVIVLHDGHGHGRRVTEILEAIIPRIKSLGYEFVRVEEMWKQREQAAAGREADSKS